MKDLHRSAIASPFLKSDSGQQALKRILCAFSLRNPDIGYGQGLNFISAVLLEYLSEEETFWSLCGLVEEILPPNWLLALTTTGTRQSRWEPS